MRQTLASMIAQTARPSIWIIVDDGSTDGSAEIAEVFAQQDGRFRPVRISKTGLLGALQRGCSESRGDFVARMDADDRCLPLRLESQLGACQQHPDWGVSACRVAFGGDRASQAGYALHVEWTNGLLTPEDHFRYRFVESPVAHPSVMWRREVMECHGGYAEAEGPEDYELWLRWMGAGVRFGKLDQVGLVWNDPPHRLSRTHPAYRVEQFYEVKCRYLAEMVPTGRPIWLWGSGRVTRRRFRALEVLRGPFQGFVDVDPRKIGQQISGRPVVAPPQLPEEAFVITGVGSRGAREKMESFLVESGREWGRDFLVCA